jgi:hypothetical protein
MHVQEVDGVDTTGTGDWTDTYAAEHGRAAAREHTGDWKDLLILTPPSGAGEYTGDWKDGYIDERG